MYSLKLIVYLVFITVPFSLLVHELGHLFGATLVKADYIELVIGRGKRLFVISFKRVTITFNILLLFGAFTRSNREQPFTELEKVTISLFGPLCNGLVTMLSFILYMTYQNDLLYMMSLFNVWLCLSNLIPIKVGKKQSDGYTIYKIILKRYILKK